MRFFGRASSERLYGERRYSSRRSTFKRQSLQRIESPPRIRLASIRRGTSLPDLQFNSGMDILRGVLSLAHGNYVTIDSLILRLHSNATVILLVTFSVAITARQYVGNPIDCIHTRDIPEEVLNTYCWIHSTYTVIDAFRKSNAAYPGVENSYGKGNEKSPTKQVKYYQWVAFMLFFQVFMLITLVGFVKGVEKKVRIGFASLHQLFSQYQFQKNFTHGDTLLTPYGVFNTDVLCFWDVFCWIHSTYSIDEAFFKEVGNEIIYPGITNSKTMGSNKRYHKYYQWSAFVLLIQALLFYTPRWLWKSWEGGKIHALMMDLDVGICTDLEKKQKKKLMLDYLWENLRYHNWWAYKYYLCEVLALVNVVGQMFLMNRFFDGAFLTFGIDVIAFLDSDQEDRVDPMIQIFPRMTKCTFYKYGVSGEVERHDAICILPLNVVNEKIYVFLWFWFIILAILTFVTVIYRIIIIFSPRMRVYLLRMRYRLIRKDAIDLIVRKSKMGDWFLFYMLGENVDSVIFRDVMQELANKIGRHNFHHIGFKAEIQEA